MAALKSAPTGSFDGFEKDDFDVFTVPGFAARMPLLRARIKPKLIAIATELSPRISEIVGETLYPHVAQHLRRTVNAPVETWAAFSRSARAYKPFVHYRIGISEQKCRVTVFVEDYCDDKELFANCLRKSARSLAGFFARNPQVLAYEMRNSRDVPTHGKAVNTAALQGFAARLLRVKGQHAVFGIEVSRSDPAVAVPSRFFEAALRAVEVLRPIYVCGASRK